MTIDEAINIAESGERTDNDPLAVLAFEFRAMRTRHAAAEMENAKLRAELARVIAQNEQDRVDAKYNSRRL